MSSSSSTSSGMGCLTVVGIVFIVLKVLDVEPVAYWSWLWVLCPFWAPIALIVVLFFGINVSGGWDAVVANAKEIPGYLSLTASTSIQAAPAGSQWAANRTRTFSRERATASAVRGNGRLCRTAK